MLDAAGGKAALFQVLLVVVFGGVELCGRQDLGYYGPSEAVAAFQAGFGGLGGGLLLGRVIEDRGPVLGAYVGALAVEGRGVVVLPEYF